MLEQTGVDALAIATGKEQVIESNWQISVPDNVIGKGLDLSAVNSIQDPLRIVLEKLSN